MKFSKYLLWQFRNYKDISFVEIEGLVGLDLPDGCHHIILSNKQELGARANIIIKHDSSLPNSIVHLYEMLHEAGVLIIKDLKDDGISKIVSDLCSREAIISYIDYGYIFIHKPTKEMESFKGLHKGERCFILGNGPSLNQTNLDLIKNEYSIAMNRISMLYSRTSWRPTYYVYMSDNVLNPEWGKQWTKSVNEAVRERGTTSFIWKHYIDSIERQNLSNRVVEVQSITEGEIGDLNTFSTNASQWISKSSTTMNAALQLAYYMGFSQIFLIGIDLNWTTTDSKKGDPNHFDTSYSARIADGEAERKRMRDAHKFAYGFFKESGNRQIYNASVSTLVDVYPLVDFKAVANNPGWCGNDDDMDMQVIKGKREQINKYWYFQRYLLMPRVKSVNSIRYIRKIPKKIKKRIRKFIRS